MANILIREAKGSDLLTIRKLMLGLIEAIDDTEGIDIELIPENCRSLLSEASSHFSGCRGRESCSRFYQLE